MASKKKSSATTHRAYLPVPEGSKANWDVPAGTPWKKDSPYNPANARKGGRGATPTDIVKAKPTKPKMGRKGKATTTPNAGRSGKTGTSTVMGGRGSAPKKTTAPAKSAAKKVVAKKPATSYQKAVSNPAKSAGSAKVKLRPYKK